MQGPLEGGCPFRRWGGLGMRQPTPIGAVIVRRNQHPDFRNAVPEETEPRPVLKAAGLRSNPTTLAPFAVRDTILFFANIYSDEVVADRGLPPLDLAAGWNRTLGIAKALASTGHRIEVVSQGITWNASYTRIFHRATIQQFDGVRLRTLTAVGLPRFGKVISGWSTVFGLLRLLHRQDVHTAVFYNYSVLYWWLILICRIRHIQTVIDFEEAVRVPSIRSTRFLSWVRTATRASAMSACLRMVDKIVLPASSLESWLPSTKPRCVVPYVVPSDIAALPDRPLGRRLEVLFSGPYRDEHGLSLLIDAIAILERDPAVSMLSFHFTGNLGLAARSRLEACLSAHSATFHGFIDRSSYLKVLSQCDVGLALQLRQGSVGDSHVPSKAFEYLAAGELVVACDVGDFAALGPDRLVLLADESAEELATVLCDLSRDRETHERIRRSGAAWATDEWSVQKQGQRLEHFLRLSTR